MQKLRASLYPKDDKRLISHKKGIDTSCRKATQPAPTYIISTVGLSALERFVKKSRISSKEIVTNKEMRISECGISDQLLSRTKLKIAIRPAPFSRILSSNSGLNNESVELRASPGKYSWVDRIGPRAACKRT